MAKYPPSEDESRIWMIQFGKDDAWNLVQGNAYYRHKVNADKAADRLNRFFDGLPPRHRSYGKRHRVIEYRAIEGV